MENLLLLIVKDASGAKFAELRNTCQELHDFLEAQQGTLRAPPHELREKCVSALKLALDSRNSKLIAHAVSGFQKLLRDDRFQSNFECEQEDQWLPCQLLAAIGSIKSHHEDTQVDLLKILLNMACSTWWSMNEAVILRILRSCQEAYMNSSQAIKIAAQATASQTIWAFCNHLQNEDKIIQKNPYLHAAQKPDEDISSTESAFNNLVPILQYLCRKLQQKPRNNNLKERVIPFYLETLLSLVSVLPGRPTALKSYPMQDYLWKEFCPTLLSLLGSPKTDNVLTTSAQKQNAGNADIHVDGALRRSNVFAASPVLTSSEAKTVYNIAIELVRLAGPFRALRPMLESVFHRILLYTSPAHRLEALKATKDILKKPERLLCFGGLPLVDDEKVPCSTDLGLIKLAIDAFVECSYCNDRAVCYQSVDCVVALLDSLEHICEGQGLSSEQINQINNLYTSLESSDYTGPMTYQSWEKLKKLSERNQSTSHDQSETDEEDSEINSEDVPKDGLHGCANEDDEIDNESDELQKSLEGETEHKETIAAAEADEESLKSITYSNGKRDNDIPSGYETDSSGSTEGPEEGFDEIEELENIHDDETEDQTARRQRIPKTLLGFQNGEAEQERIAQLYETRDLYAQQERNNARHFVSILRNLLPKLLLIKSSIEADEVIQEFASKYCEEVTSCQISKGNKNNEALHNIIVNADGVYLATYSSLSLNLKLVQAGYYNKEFLKEPPLTEEQFIEDVHGSGVLVYLSATWLAELYQQILVDDLLTQSGYDINSHENFALINLLTDLEGLNSDQQGSYLLSDYFRLEKTVLNDNSGPDVQAGRKFARRILTGCWDGILEVLSVLLNGKNAIGLSNALGLMLGTEGAKEEHRRARDAVANCLDGLQKAARLSNILNVHSRCEAVFALLAEVSCPVANQSDGIQSRRKRLKSSVMALKSRPMKLHASHILSMDVILSRGLELGSYSPDCWKHVFRCCIYLAELEHSFFSKGLLLSSTPKRSACKENDLGSKLHRTEDLSEECLQFPASSLHPACTTVINIPELVKENISNLSTGGILSSEQSLQALCALSQLADRLFDDAAYKLNRKALLDFLNALCFASQANLFSNPAKQTGSGSAKPCPTGGHSNVSLLHRTADVMLKCVRSGRPLIHVMQAWSIVGLHLMEAACHKDQDVAKRAVTSIHDIVNALLASQSELPYFHFNEALFKPFENLLCLELCDNDIQDQIISSICEFVEGCTTEIRSGWRPLFGALRTVRPTVNSHSVQDIANQEVSLNSNHVRVVLDVFEAFLNTENVLVFANAAVDCILCLLKHIKGEFGDALETCVSTSTSPDFCLASLKYLHKCCSILASMQKMPSCPIFHASNRIQFPSLQFIDPDIPGMDLVQFDEDENLQPIENTTFRVVEHLESPSSFSKPFALESFQGNLLTLEHLESPSGILHVWCLILEGLMGAVVSSQKAQSCTMETLFDLLQKIYELPGFEFGLYIINHLVLPSVQSWLRRTSRIYRGWDNFASQFKQCCGQVTDLVVDYIVKLAESNLLASAHGVQLMLYQLLQLLIECVAQSTESISRLGCSCIRHIIVTSGPFLVGDLWDILCQALSCACRVSLFSVRQLMVAFRANSDNFYGDIGQVKVAAKSDCSPEENERLKQLAQQVFLLDNQRSVPHGMFLDDPIDDDRSYIFLLYPPGSETSLNPEVFVVKVPFRSLVVGLLAHQILLQTIGAILLQGLPHIVPSLANILLQSPAPTPSSLPNHRPETNVDQTEDKSFQVNFQLPGMLQHLSRKQLFTLLNCLEDSYKTACEFDVRPGLKFLVQKVARANAAANLYKQTGASWTIRSIVLLELCLHCQQYCGDVKATESMKEEARYFAVKMKDTLSDMCSLYAELFVKKESDCFDRLQDQPIFFLVAQTDDYMETRHKNDEKMSPMVAKDEEVKLAPEERATEEVHKSEASDESPESAHDVLAELGNEEDEEKEEDDTQIYSVATQKDIDCVVEEFKKRKQQHAMPIVKRDKRKNPFNVERMRQHRADVQETKLPSVLKDHEAQVKVRTEMLLSAFDFFCQLDDSQFKSLLPSVFPFVRTLVAHGNDSTLRQTLAEFLDRLASLYSFGTEP